MSSNTSMYACPKCGNPNTHVERRPNGFCYCPDCQHRWKIEESQPKPTLFERITASEELLAPCFVYHITSFLDGLNKPKRVWYSTLINNQYFNTELEAKRATVAKLKEVVKNG